MEINKDHLLVTYEEQREAVGLLLDTARKLGSVEEELVACAKKGVFSKAENSYFARRIHTLNAKQNACRGVIAAEAIRARVLEIIASAPDSPLLKQ